MLTGCVEMITDFPSDLCLPGIKKYVVGLIIKTSSDASNVEVSRVWL